MRPDVYLDDYTVVQPDLFFYPVHNLPKRSSDLPSLG